MPRSVHSVDEAISYFSDRLADVHANAMTTEAIAIVVLQTLVRENIATAEDLDTSIRAQIGAVRFRDGDDELNAEIRRRAEARAGAICSVLARSH